MDIVNPRLPHDLRDLSNDLTWTEIDRRLRKGVYSGVGVGTPCTTFSAARTGPPGPRPLRSAEFPYGLLKAQLDPAEFEQSRFGTYFAL